MHIHLPKPLHGWREFLGEIAIIVIGILLALGAEQVIETQHWKHRSELTTETVQSDLQDAYIQAAEAAVIAPCVDQQLVNLEGFLTRPGFKGVPIYSDGTFNKFVVRAPSRPWSTSVWDAATSEATVSHLPSSLRGNFERAYNQIAIMASNTRQADVLSWRLRALTFPVDGDSRSRSLETIEELRGRIDFMALVANQIMGRIDSIGMTPEPALIEEFLSESGTVRFCRAHAISLGRPNPTSGL